MSAQRPKQKPNRQQIKTAVATTSQNGQIMRKRARHIPSTAKVPKAPTMYTKVYTQGLGHLLSHMKQTAETR